MRLVHCGTATSLSEMSKRERKKEIDDKVEWDGLVENGLPVELSTE